MMRHLRGDGAHNALNLGPYYEHAVAHMKAIVLDPDLLIGPNASYMTGSLDGKAWERPEAIYRIISMHRRGELPQLRKVVVVFFTGGAVSLSENTAKEFKSIEPLSAREHGLAACRSTNDHNEGSLGRFRVRKRAAPSKSELTYNAETMYADNSTHRFYSTLSIADRTFIRSRARALNLAGLEKQNHIRQAEHDVQVVEANKLAVAAKAAKAAEEAARIDAFKPHLERSYWDAVITGNEATTTDDIRAELRWHNRHNKAVKPTKFSRAVQGSKNRHNLNKQELLAAVRIAVNAYIAAASTISEQPANQEGDVMDVDVDEGGYDSEDECLLHSRNT
jgi:hypothetical protein